MQDDTSKGAVRQAEVMGPDTIEGRMRARIRETIDVIFRQGLAEALPSPDGQFDLVLSTVMLPHLPRKIRQEAAVETRRVPKPEGRVLVVDFGASRRQRRSLIGHFHRHGRTNIDDIVGLLSAAGLHRIDSGEVGANDLYFVLAAPHPTGER